MMPKRIERRSDYEYRDGVDIHKTDDYIHINSISIPVDDWADFATWVLQTVATLKVEDHEYESVGRVSLTNINKLVEKSMSMKVFDRDDAFYKRLKKR